jgi:hypothetical protein
MTPEMQVQSADGAAAAFEAFVQNLGAAGSSGDVKPGDTAWTVSGCTRSRSEKTVEQVGFVEVSVAYPGRVNLPVFVRPFADFVRAYGYLIQRESSCRRSSAYYRAQLLALKYLHEALGPTRKNPWELRRRHFEAATRACLQRMSHSSAYRVGHALAAIADTMDTHRLGEVRLDWASPIKRPQMGLRVLSGLSHDDGNRKFNDET